MKQLGQRLTELEQAQRVRKHGGNAMERIQAKLARLASNIGPMETEPITPAGIAELRAMVVQEVQRYASY